MTRQREQARAAGKFKVAQGLEYAGAATTFHGYERLAYDDAKVVAIYVGGSAAASARAGDDAVVVLDQTPFYAESGGQVGDTGELRNATSRMLVEDTVKIQAAVFGHEGRVVEGEIRIGDTLTAKVDIERRAKTVRNHSATHLMHKALREVLGGHVQQKGSLVDADKTRFDFTHNAPLTDEQIRRVEQIVNAEILANHATQARVMAIDEAQKLGAVMLFGEKYGDEVRVLDIGSSRELCGGTHVERTGDIGLFKIVAESGVAAGIRRVEAVTGANALAYLQALEGTVQRLAGALRSAPAEVPARLGQVLEHVRSLEKELAALKGRLASSQGGDPRRRRSTSRASRCWRRVSTAPMPALRDTLDKLGQAQDGGRRPRRGRRRAGPDRCRCHCRQHARVKAGDLVNFVAQQVGGKGGGKADMAMAGGSDPSRLGEALASVQGWVAERV
jgi:alanyl-tRNA synthetase